MTTDITEENLAQWCEAAIGAHMVQCRGFDEHEEDPAHVLAGLMHYAVQEQIDFDLGCHLCHMHRQKETVS